MKLVICAGPPTCGKTTVLRQVTKRLLAKQLKVSFLKIDVQYADEDEIFTKEFSIPTRKVYSGELCPDHCTVMVLGDAIQWAEQSGANILLVETAGLCLRCSPYVDGLLGIVVVLLPAPHVHVTVAALRAGELSSTALQPDSRFGLKGCGSDRVDSMISANKDNANSGQCC